MNVDLIKFVYDIPRGVVTPCEKSVLLAIANSLPTFDGDGRVLNLSSNYREPAKKRIANGKIVSFECETDKEYGGMFIDYSSQGPFTDGGMKVEEANARMRVSDILSSEENLTIWILSQRTGYSESAVREAKKSLTRKSIIEVRGDCVHQRWIIFAYKLTQLKKSKVQIKKIPGRARIKTVKTLKQRAEERQREAEQQAEQQEKLKRDERNSIRLCARHFGMGVKEFKSKIKDGSIRWDDDLGQYIYPED